MTIKSYRDTSGHSIAYDDEPGPLPEEFKEQLAQALISRFGGKITEEADRIHDEELLAKRQERLTREELESLTPQERAEFDRDYGVERFKRFAEQARREIDEHFDRTEQEYQEQELRAWEQTQSGGIGSREQYRKLQQLFEEGSKRYEERRKARERRELEAEAFDDEILRINATLDEEEREVFKRLIAEAPSRLESVRQFKGAKRNPIQDIDDTRTLYRMATQKPQKEQWVEPLANIDNVDDPRMLYAMARKQIEEKQKEKRK